MVYLFPDLSQAGDAQYRARRRAARLRDPGILRGRDAGARNALHLPARNRLGYRHLIETTGPCLCYSDEGTLLSLFGRPRLKQRVQHPKVHERKDRKGPYWFFRYWHDEILTGWLGEDHPEMPHVRAQQRAGCDHEEAGRRSTATISWHDLNAAPTRAEAAVAAQVPDPADEPGQIIFGKLAELWRQDYVENRGWKPMWRRPRGRSTSSRSTTTSCPSGRTRASGICAVKDVLDWLQDECTSWHMMSDLRGVMSGIITKAIEWEILPETFANPIHRVKLPKKWEVREKRILNEEQTAQVLARLDEPGNLLICETCLDTGTRISEVTGLMIKHVDLEKGIHPDRATQLARRYRRAEDRQEQAHAGAGRSGRPLPGLDRQAQAQGPGRLGLPPGGDPSQPRGTPACGRR